MKDAPYATLENVYDKVFVYEVCFLPGSKATHTLLFGNPQRVHVYVDVNETTPVALTLIHGTSVGIEYSQAVRGNAEHLSSMLQLANELIIYDKERRQEFKDKTRELPITQEFDALVYSELVE